MSLSATNPVSYCGKYMKSLTPFPNSAICPIFFGSKHLLYEKCYSIAMNFLKILQVLMSLLLMRAFMYLFKVSILRVICC